MIRTKVKIHKDENKSLYIQTFIFVLMNLSLYINDLSEMYLCLVLVRFTFVRWGRYENNALQAPVAYARIRKYQNICTCSFCL